MTDLSQRIASLSPEKRLLLELARKRSKSHGASAPVAASRPFDLISEADRRRIPEGIEDAYPLTLLQAGMLYHMEMTPEEPAYLNVDSWHLRAPFEEAAFRRAAQIAVSRHAVMRTSFDLTSYSEPMQLVHARAELPIRVDDIRSLPAAEQEDLLDALIWREKRQPFDLSCPPLLRFWIHRRSEGSFQLTMAENHAIWDGWSLHSTLTEIFTLYFAFLAGETPVEEEPLAVCFRDFVALERSALASREQGEFWRRMMAEFAVAELPPRFGIPVDAAAPRTRIVSTPFSPELMRSLHKVARMAGGPYKSVALAVHLKVLGLVSGRADVVSGVAWNGRPEDRDGERLRGLFLNTLPFRLSLRSESWIDLIRRTFAAEQEAIPFRRYPLAALQQELGGPLFEVTFNYIQFHVVDTLLGAGAVEVIGFKKHEGTGFGLVAHFDQAGLQLEYDAGRLADAQVQMIAGYYSRALAALILDPTARHDAVPLLSEAERHQVVNEWSAPSRNEDAAESLLELLATQVRARGEASAVNDGEEVLSYGELWERGLRLARRLRRLGVGPETRVGLCAERSSALVVGIVAILQAGGAYVPLDPAYPAESLGFLLHDSAIRVVVGQGGLADRLPAGGWSWVDITEGEDGEGGLVPVDPDGAAYVIYTSGSTGRPKGVVVSHRNVARLLAATAEDLGLGPADVWTLFHSFAFDFSVWEIWGALACGGRLVIVPYWISRTPERFCELLEREGVTVLNQTPSAFRSLQRAEAERGGPLSLRVVIFGGEALEPSSLRGFAARHPAVRLVNMYGITETTVHVTCRALEDADLSGGRSAIGRALGHLGLYALDDRGDPVPAGVRGELYVSGGGLARGYLGRPELTAERFVPDSLGREPGGRLYRTGDLGRCLVDGELEYLGRIDTQVKVRGFRIELGEIEAVLSSLEGVHEAVVVAREDMPGDGRLVAYVVGEAEESEIRGLLRERLPEHMIPAAFVTLDALPLTPNGKVDRKSLPAPEWRSPEAVYKAPRTLVEEVLAGIWAEVLGRERVGVADHFFEMGGHSLLATRVMSRVRVAFRVDLPLSDLFEAPTIAGLAARIEASRDGGSVPPAPPLVREPRDGELPLSFAQQRLWSIDQLEPGHAAYNITSGLRLTGTLDLPVLRASFRELVRRHESLRTTFPSSNGRPWQRIHSAGHAELPVVDLEVLPEPCRDGEVRRLAAEHAGRPFDLGQGPLFRPALLRLAATEHALLCTMHHIVSDGWSMGILAQEVAAVYSALMTGQRSPLPELPVQYADYAVWQRNWLQGPDLERHLSYWRQQLAGAPPLLALPTDRSRPAERRFRGSRKRLELSRDLSASLQVLARRQGSTLFMLFLAAFQVLLSRYTAETDVVVGAPVSGRDRLETEGLIGLFVNTLVLRGDLSGDPGFDRLLSGLREIVLLAQEHQHLPFERLVDELRPERQLSYAPLFQVLISYEKLRSEELKLPGLELSGMGVGTVSTKFDLTLSLQEGEGWLGGGLDYDIDLFDRATIDRLLGHFRALLSGIATNPEKRLSELPLLDASERCQIAAWNDTGKVETEGPLVHELFQSWAANTPEANALVFESEALSYRALNERANQLACRLRKLGCGPDAKVGVLLERSLEMIIAILGTLKAGAAYVPLDPLLPPGRLDFLRQDAALTALVTQSELREKLTHLDLPVAFLDSSWTDLADESCEDPQWPIEPETLAYVIYTSGSTGTPKGVGVEHRQLLSYVNGVLDKLALPEQASYAMVSTIAADLGNTVLFPSLCTGGCLHVSSLARLSDPQGMEEYFSRYSIDCVKIVPSHLAALQSSQHPELLMPRRLLILGGEASSWSFIDGLHSMAPGCRILNHYGPTETTVGVTTFEVGAAGERRSTTVPLGRPNTGTRVWLLDRWRQAVPVGIPGELHVGGSNISRGYLGRPDLTAERFIPDPFALAAGDRLYKTGDLARFLPSGDIEFLGRVDHQVKIRGIRVEPGEVQAALLGHPEVREAVVVARNFRSAHSGDIQLVAYVVPRYGAAAAPSAADLRRFLLGTMPEVLIPAVFVFLDGLPLTPNGKIDRAALPVPKPGTSNLDGAFVAPRGLIEETLANIWKEVLRLDRVGVHDNFFELGGDSILSIQIVARSSAFGLRVTARQIFQHQTVAELATVVGTLAGPDADQDAVTGLVPLTPIQSWFFERNLNVPHHYNQAVLLELREPPRADLLKQAVDHLLEHHDALRLRFAVTEAGWSQRNDPPEGASPFCEIDLGKLPMEARRPVLESAAAALQGSLDLRSGPLMRVALFRMEDAPARLQLAIHHLAVDGVSWRILLEDLAGAYWALARGEEVRLPSKTTSFKRWAEALTKHASSPGIQGELFYWNRELQKRIFRLPTDAADERNAVADTATVSVWLDPESTQALLHEVPRAYHTQIHEVLLTALVQTFVRWTGDHRLLVELEGHGREEIDDSLDLSRTVGWFTTRFPVVLELTRSTTPGQALMSIKEQIRAIPGKGIGYGLLRYLSEHRDGAEALGPHVAPEVSFNYLGQLDQILPESSPFAPAEEAVGPTRAPSDRRTFMLEILGRVVGSRLRMDWIYGARLHQRGTIERLAAWYLESLRALIDHCRSAEAGGFTPSDFPRAGLSKKDLDKVLSKIGGRMR